MAAVAGVFGSALAADLAAGPPLLFDGRFEMGTYRPWSVPQCKNGADPVDDSSVRFGTYAVESRTVGQGKYGARVELPAWSGGKTRCEVFYRRTEASGSDDYYSYMVYLPSGWTPGTSAFWGVEILQLDHTIFGGSAIDFQAHADHITVAVQTGACSTTTTLCQYRSNADSGGSTNLPPLYAVPPGQLQLGVWHEFVIHVHWATDSSGQLEIWHRLKGQTNWTKTANLSGYPTLQVDSNGVLPSGTTDKEGVYRGPSTAPTTVWLDGFTRSGSFATAAGQLP